LHVGFYNQPAVAANRNSHSIGNVLLPSLKHVVVIELISHSQKNWAARERLLELIVSWDNTQASLKDGSAGSAPNNHFTAVPFTHPQFIL